MTKPIVKLVGKDGNAFGIIGICREVAKKANWSQKQIGEFVEKAMSGDYRNLLRTVGEYFEIH